MGQPTAALTQRVGRTQLWQNVPGLGQRDRGFGEHLSRLGLSNKLAAIFFQSLVVTAGSQLWYRATSRRSVYYQTHWGRVWRLFPNTAAARVMQRYFEIAAPRHLLFDGEQTFLTIAYRHRRLRLTSLY